MKRFLGGLALVGLLLSPAGTAQAQLFNMPVWSSPAFGSGVGIYGDFGVGLNDDAKFTDPVTETLNSAPLAFGGHVMVGVSMFQIWAGASYVDPKDDNDPALIDNEVSFGGAVALTLYRGATSPVVVNLQVGAGYVKFADAAMEEEEIWNFPVSLGIAHDAQLQGGAAVKPWIAPVLQIYNTKSTEAGVSGGSETDIGFGVAGGIEVVLGMGLGFYVNADWQTVTFGDADESTRPFRLGAGLSYVFRVPSFGDSRDLAGG